MTQAEVIWTLLSMVQVGVIGFVTYWTRRVQHLEDLITKSAEQRTQMLVDLTKLQGETQAIKAIVTRIEMHMDRRNEEE